MRLFWIAFFAAGYLSPCLMAVSADQILDGHSKPVLALAVSSDGKLLASASEDATICLWNLSTGKLLRKLAGHREAVRALAFDADGKSLLSGGTDAAVVLWDVTTGKELTRLIGSRKPIRQVAWLPGGRFVRAYSAEESTVFTWDRSTGKEHARTRVGRGSQLAWSASGLFAFSETLVVWDLDSGKERAQCSELKLRSRNVVTTASTGGGRAVERSSESLDLISCVALSSDATLAVSAHSTLLEESTTETVVKAGKTTESGQLTEYQVSQTVLRLWDGKTGKPVRSLTGHSGLVRALHLSVDGKRLLSSSGHHVLGLTHKELGDGESKVEESKKTVDCTALLWDVPTGRILWRSAEQTAPLLVCVLSPDGRVITGGADGKVRIHGLAR